MANQKLPNAKSHRKLYCCACEKDVLTNLEYRGTHSTKTKLNKKQLVWRCPTCFNYVVRHNPLLHALPFIQSKEIRHAAQHIEIKLQAITHQDPVAGYDCLNAMRKAIGRHYNPHALKSLSQARNAYRALNQISSKLPTHQQEKIKKWIATKTPNVIKKNKD